MSAPLNELLDQLQDQNQLADPDALYNGFTNWAQSTGRPLYPHQEEALLELLDNHHVIAATPTGSGKSLIALAAHTISLAREGRSYYTAPLKALVSEKFFDLVAAFGAPNVGMITGDIALNTDAPIICCTAEILANQALREGDQLDADIIVMDEFHFYGEPDRGWAWQIPLLELPQCQFVLLSATLGDVSFFVEDLKKRTGKITSVIESAKRPIPLQMSYTLTPLHQAVTELIELDKYPIYVVHFTQRQATQTAQNLANSVTISQTHREKLKHATRGFKFTTGFGQTLRKLLHAGIGIHHAGMLPRYRRLVERLTQAGLLAAICGTDTLGVGINVPITTVIFTSLTKYDGSRQRLITAREFHQIAGRAGRAGYDETGWVIVQAPEHVIENNHAKLKAGDDPKKLRKLTRKHLPEGHIGWTETTFERLKNATPEPLQPQLRITHALVLNALQSPKPATQHLLELATNNHHQHDETNPHLRQLGHIYNSLQAAHVIETHPTTAPPRERLQLVADLPEDFALNQPLSPFALAALDLLDPQQADYPLDVISTIEAILEDPTPLLLAQRKQARNEAMEQMKAAGVEYDQRLATIDTISWPQPLAQQLNNAYDIYKQSNPWVIGHHPHPKSVLRQMVEEALTFTELISRYDIARSEGIILRYLTDAYRTLRQTIPEDKRTDEIDNITDWVGKLINAIDSSLLDEWDDLAQGKPHEHPGPNPEDETPYGALPDGTIPLTANPHRWHQQLRNLVHSRINRFALDDSTSLAGYHDHDGQVPWDQTRWEEALDRYYEQYDWLGATANARTPSRYRIITPAHTADLADAGIPDSLIETHQTLLEREHATLITYTMEDPEGDDDWEATWLIDHQTSAQTDQIKHWLLKVGPR